MPRAYLMTFLAEEEEEEEEEEVEVIVFLSVSSSSEEELLAQAQGRQERLRCTYSTSVRVTVRRGESGSFACVFEWVGGWVGGREASLDLFHFG